MECRKCGVKLSSDVFFCPHCGTEPDQSATPPSAQIERQSHQQSYDSVAQPIATTDAALAGIAEDRQHHSQVAQPDSQVDVAQSRIETRQYPPDYQVVPPGQIQEDAISASEEAIQYPAGYQIVPPDFEDDDVEEEEEEAHLNDSQSHAITSNTISYSKDGVRSDAFGELTYDDDDEYTTRPIVHDPAHAGNMPTAQVALDPNAPAPGPAQAQYGRGIRAQVFDVIVRQAMKGGNWREICQSQMHINGINPDHVEAEVKKRMGQGGNGTSDPRDAGTQTGVGTPVASPNSWQRSSLPLSGPSPSHMLLNLKRELLDLANNADSDQDRAERLSNILAYLDDIMDECHALESRGGLHSD